MATRFLFGFLVLDCIKKNNLAKKWQKNVNFFAKKLQINKKIFGESLDYRCKQNYRHVICANVIFSIQDVDES